MADVLLCDQSLYSKYERGERSLPLDLAVKLAQVYGVSLHRFIQQARFRHAEELLRLHSDWPMHQVATAAGYSDLSTMYRAFRNLGGITPGALRDALRQKHE